MWHCSKGRRAARAATSCVYAFCINQQTLLFRVLAVTVHFQKWRENRSSWGVTVMNSPDAPPLVEGGPRVQPAYGSTRRPKFNPSLSPSEPMTPISQLLTDRQMQGAAQSQRKTLTETIKEGAIAGGQSAGFNWTGDLQNPFIVIDSPHFPAVPNCCGSASPHVVWLNHT